MLAVVASQVNRNWDEIDAEFEAVYKADQRKRGIPYNGLKLVVDNTRPDGVQPERLPVGSQKSGFRRMLEELMFGDATA